MNRQVRRTLVEPGRADLSIVRHCRLLSISSSTFYASPQAESDTNLSIMAKIDRQFLDTPFYGVRQMTWHLRAKDWPVKVKRVRRLMTKIGLMPIYQRPRTSTPAPGRKINPYLLRGLTIDRTHPEAEDRRRAHLELRQRPMAGQRVRRAAMAILEIRVRLPARMKRRPRGPRRDRQMEGLLQTATSSYCA